MQLSASETSKNLFTHRLSQCCLNRKIHRIRGPRMKLLKPTLGIAALGAVALSITLANEALSKYEEPPFKVIEKLGKNIEVREYRPRIAAEVTVDKEWDDALNSGFRILAGYIFGKNRSNQKVAMTAPVTAQKDSEAINDKSIKIAMTTPVTATRAEEPDAAAGWRIRFYMPAKYSLDTLPEPEDKRIKLKELPAESFAVIKFSGWSSQDSFTKHLEELKKKLSDSSKFKESGEPTNAFYNPPWTLPFLRRNEILIQVEQASES